MTEVAGFLDLLPLATNPILAQIPGALPDEIPSFYCILCPH